MRSGQMAVVGTAGGRRAGWPMYVADRPAAQAWWRGLASGLRERGVAGVPDALDEPDDAVALEAHWLDPRLLLSQTCGYPLVTRLAGAVQVVGTFRWTAPGCDGIAYRSWLVARAERAAPAADASAKSAVAPTAMAARPAVSLSMEPASALATVQVRPAIVASPGATPAPPIHSPPEAAATAELAAALAADPVRAIEPFRGGVAAFNDARSHSGCNALRALVAPLSGGATGRFFSRAIETGSHGASLAAVRDGRADIAAIDCISWAGLRRTAPWRLAGLRVIGSSAPAPGLPLITSAATPPAELAALRNALVTACADVGLADTRAALFIGSFEVVEVARWDAVDAMRRGALALGCEAL